MTTGSRAVILFGPQSVNRAREKDGGASRMAVSTDVEEHEHPALLNIELALCGALQRSDRRGPERPHRCGLLAQNFHPRGVHLEAQERRALGLAPVREGVLREGSDGLDTEREGGVTLGVAACGANHLVLIAERAREGVSHHVAVTDRDLTDASAVPAPTSFT